MIGYFKKMEIIIRENVFLQNKRKPRFKFNPIVRQTTGPWLNQLFIYLKEVPFNTTFYKSPVVILSVDHGYDRKVKSFRLPENNIISAWMEVSLNICIFYSHAQENIKVSILSSHV